MSLIESKAALMVSAIALAMFGWLSAGVAQDPSAGPCVPEVGCPGCTCTMDGAGRLLELNEDYDLDGAIDATTRFEYNSLGRMTLMEADTDLDGHYEVVTRYEWRLDGSLASQLIDEGPGTTPVLINYAPDGTLTMAFDSDRDGVFTLEDYGLPIGN